MTRTCLFLAVLLLAACGGEAEVESLPVSSSGASSSGISSSGGASSSSGSTSSSSGGASSSSSGGTSFQATSTSFTDGGNLATAFTRYGANRSLQVSWSGAPIGTATVAVILDDPDAVAVAGYTWVHWNLFAIPATTTSLAEGAGTPAGATAGRNHFGTTTYEGPEPPEGSTHTYRLGVYALSSGAAIPTAQPLTRQQFESQYAARILAHDVLSCRFTAPSAPGALAAAGH